MIDFAARECDRGSTIRAIASPQSAKRSMTAEPVLRVLTICRQDFERRLCAVSPADWGKPTPCSQWDVRLLVNHVVSQEFRIARLITGGTFAEYVATRDDD